MSFCTPGWMDGLDGTLAEIEKVSKLSQNEVEIEKEIEKMKEKKRCVGTTIESTKAALKVKVQDALQHTEQQLGDVECVAEDLVKSGGVDGLLKKRNLLSEKVVEMTSQLGEVKEMLANVESQLKPLTTRNHLKRLRDDFETFLGTCKGNGATSDDSSVVPPAIPKAKKVRKREREKKA
eukprot:3940736-Rhodomonas_salina.2